MGVPVGYGLGVIQFDLTGDPEPQVVTCGLDLSNAGGDFQTAVETFGVSFAARFDQYLHTQWTIEKSLLYVGQDGTTATVPYEALIDVEGTATGAPITSNTAVLVRKLSGLPGRRNKGRMYMPGFIAEDSVSPTGIITQSGVDNRQDLFDDWWDDLTVPGSGIPFAIPPCIFHASGDQTPTLISEFQVDSLVATQRQRMRR